MRTWWLRPREKAKEQRPMWWRMTAAILDSVFYVTLLIRTESYNSKRRLPTSGPGRMTLELSLQRLDFLAFLKATATTLQARQLERVLYYRSKLNDPDTPPLAYLLTSLVREQVALPKTHYRPKFLSVDDQTSTGSAPVGSKALSETRQKIPQ